MEEVVGFYGGIGLDEHLAGVLQGLFKAEAVQNIAIPRCGGFSVWG